MASEPSAAVGNSLFAAPAQQLRTYHRFLIAVRYVVVANITVGSLLVIGFCTSASWPMALMVAVIELWLGLRLARDRRRITWPPQVPNLMTTTTSVESGEHLPEPARAAE